jgi:hypothetical protein
MLKFKISKKENSDVTEYRAKGWVAKVLREANPNNTMIIVESEKDNTMFKLRTILKDGEILGELTQLYYGETISTKYFPTNGCGVFGTLYVFDASDPKKIYAFFRNEELQNLMDYFSIRKITFTDDNTSAMSDRITKKFYYEDQSDENKYKTDGYNTHNCIKNEEDNTISHSVNITDATFILDMDQLELFLPFKYSILDIWNAVYHVYEEEGSDIDDV